MCLSISWIAARSVMVNEVDIDQWQEKINPSVKSKLQTKGKKSTADAEYQMRTLNSARSGSTP